MNSLLNSASSKLSQEVLSLQLSSAILVLDTRVVSIVSELIASSELSSLNIIGVESLQLSRKPFPSLPAIYIIAPHNDSIKLLANDYSSNKSQYKEVHLLVIDTLSKEQFSTLQQTSHLSSHIKSLREILIDFQITSPNQFIIPCGNLQQALQQEYSTERTKVCQQLGHQLATVIVSLGGFYEVEVFYSEGVSQSGGMPQDIAYNCENRLRSISQQLIDSPSLDKSSGKINVILMQRPDDINTLLIRDFHYQSLLQDILPTSNNHLQFKGKPLDSLQNDQVFNSFKFKHFGDVLENLQTDLKKFTQSSANVKLMGGNTQSNNLSKAIQELPEYTQRIQQFDLHIQIAQSIMGRIQEKKLLEIGEIEQTLAVGIDQNGKQAEGPALIKQVLACLSSNINLESIDRLRIILLVFVNVHLNNSDKQKFINKLEQSELSIIKNICKQQGIDIDQTIDKSTLRKKKTINQISQQKQQDSQQILNRHTSALEVIIGKAIKQQPMKVTGIDGITFESLQINQIMGKKSIPTSLRNKGLVDKIVGGEGKADGVRLVIFMIGGITYHEIRVLNQLQANSHIQFVIGGTSLINTQTYMQSHAI